MEKDSFETALQKIVLQSDQNSSQLVGKESVWVGVNKTTPIKKWHYYAAAAVLILTLYIGVLSIQKDKITSPIAKKRDQLQQPMQKSEIFKEEPVQAFQKTKQTPPNSKIEKMIITVKPTENLPVKPIELTLPLGKETMVVTVQKPIENNRIINEKIVTQPEFSVQFKRGKPIEFAVEKQIKIALAFSRLSFGRDTSTVVIANKNPNNPFKIKF